MSKARGASRRRFLSREGRINKFDFNTGEIKKRPFSNGKLTKKRKSGKIVAKGHHERPTMMVERNGKMVEMPKTITVTYRRRVFKDANGNYPAGAYKIEAELKGNQQEIWVVDDTREKAVSSKFCKHVQNPKGYKAALRDPRNLD